MAIKFDIPDIAQGVVAEILPGQRGLKQKLRDIFSWPGNLVEQENGVLISIKYVTTRPQTSRLSPGTRYVLFTDAGGRVRIRTQHYHSWYIIDKNYPPARAVAYSILQQAQRDMGPGQLRDRTVFGTACFKLAILEDDLEEV